MDTSRRLIVAVTGASGALYAVRLLKAGLESGLDIDLIPSDYGKRLLIEECDWNVKAETIESWLDRRYGPNDRPGSVTVRNPNDMGADVASGSQNWRGMVVIPCSMKTLSGIAAGSSSNLVERAADVTLKEGRRLVIVPRETPLNLIHLENMARLCRAGATILPAMPGFYQQPKDLDELADFIVGRVLSQLEIPHELYAPWKGA